MSTVLQVRLNHVELARLLQLQRLRGREPKNKSELLRMSLLDLIEDYEKKDCFPQLSLSEAVELLSHLGNLHKAGRGKDEFVSQLRLQTAMEILHGNQHSQGSPISGSAESAADGE